MKELLEKIQLTWKMFKALTLMVLRIRVYRRKLMFAVSLTAMFMAFCGIVLLDGFLTEHLLFFTVYWLVTCALVLLMILLAFYDMMMVKAEQSNKEIEALSKILVEVEKTEAKEKPKKK